MLRWALVSACLLGVASAALLHARPDMNQTAGKSAETAEVKLDVVKFKDYLGKMDALHGKIVIVDVWGEFCPPCKIEFPHLVEMHEKYAKKGVACVSISLDPLENQEDAIKFLKKQKAVFTNILLDEKNKVWQDHFHIFGPPAVFVYDRAGKLAARFDHNDDDKTYSYQDVEKTVQKLLEK
jgi:thiol-disulfide isomerase/thioredoxin